MPRLRPPSDSPIGSLHEDKAEIRRLRAELEQLRESHRDCQRTFDDLHAHYLAEIRQLQAEVRLAERYKAERNEARIENERLRRALPLSEQHDWTGDA